MNKPALTEVTITADSCLSKASLHRHLKESLGFPAYYGSNLSALADCLSECARPVLISVAIDADEIPAGMQAYILRLIQVCAREALANENVSLIVEHPRRATLRPS